MFFLKNSKIMVVAIFAVIAMTFSSCGKYTPRPFQRSTGVCEKKKGVTVAVNPLTEADCRYYFSRRAIIKGFQPILLTIKNSNNRAYILDGSDINLNIESSGIVSKQLHLDTTKRVLTWGLGALFLWPFIIPAAVDGVRSKNANKALNKDFRQRVIDSTSRIIIQPKSIINKVFFVTSSNYRHSFELDLVDKHNDEKLVFALNL